MATVPQSVADGLKTVANINSNRNFIHRIKGVRNGNLKYAVKRQLSEFQVSSGLKSNEKHKLQVNDFGTSKSTIKMDSGQNKQAKLEVTNKLGVKTDSIQITLDQIPVGPGRNLDVNIKPGLGGLELVGATGVNVPVKVSAVIGGKKISRQFTAPLQGGIRIKPASAMYENKLTFSRIDRLFGLALDTGLVRG